MPEERRFWLICDSVNAAGTQPAWHGGVPVVAVFLDEDVADREGKRMARIYKRTFYVAGVVRGWTKDGADVIVGDYSDNVAPAGDDARELAAKVADERAAHWRGEALKFAKAGDDRKDMIALNRADEAEAIADAIRKLS